MYGSSSGFFLFMSTTGKTKRVFLTGNTIILGAVSLKNSRLLQAVISGAGDGKFYRLLPDNENPASYDLC